MSLRTSLLTIVGLLALALAPGGAAQTPARVQEGRGLAAVKIRVENGGVIDLYEQSHALVIGVSDYQDDGWPRLPGVARDVAEVTAALARQGFRVTPLLNPTRVEFDAGMRRFISEHGQTARNRLLVYFAGHGATLTTSDGRQLGYLVPADAPAVSKGAGPFKRRAVSMAEVENYALEMESKHVLFVFDSCFSGSLFEAMRSVPDAIAGKSARPVRQFITAGTAEQQVPDNSIFRRQFVAALAGEGDLDRDGYLTGSELGIFLETSVANYTRSAQTPRWGKIRNPALDKGDFIFALPGGARPPATAAPPPRPADSLTVEMLYWDSIKGSSDPEDYLSYLRIYPAGSFADLARRRAAAHAPRPAATPAPTPLPTPAPAVREPAAGSSPVVFPVRVRADSAANGWTDTGLMVGKGQRLRVTAEGRVSLGGGRDSTPAGLPRVADTEKLMRNEPTGSLIAVIGDDNDDFIAVGAGREFFARRDGRLFLGVNEGRLDDNAGGYDALVAVEPAAAAGPIVVFVNADGANNGWTYTGVFVRRGQKVRVTAAGSVSLGGGRVSAPAGLPGVADAGKLMPREATGALIGVVGDDNDDFIYVGPVREFVAARDGKLFLGVNEARLDDNAGSFSAKIEIFN